MNLSGAIVVVGVVLHHQTQIGCQKGVKSKKPCELWELQHPLSDLHISEHYDKKLPPEEVSYTQETELELHLKCLVLGASGYHSLSLEHVLRINLRRSRLFDSIFCSFVKFSAQGWVGESFWWMDGWTDGWHNFDSPSSTFFTWLMPSQPAKAGCAGIIHIIIPLS